MRTPHRPINSRCFAAVVTVATAVCIDGLAQPWPAELRIERPPGSPVRIELLGDPGNDYAIEATENFATNRWSPLVTLSLTGTSQTWLDSRWCGRPRRFYRAVSFNGSAPLEPAPSFRLIDHLGKSRELSYHLNDTNVAAFVLLFTANGCSSVRHFAPALAGLRSRFEPQRIRFWLIDSSPDSRSNLVAEASVLGLGVPILHDRAQVVARAYHATTAPEAIGVSRGEFGWGIFYRGAIDDRKDTNAVASTQNYLADALTQYLANGTVTPRRTQPEGCVLPLPAQPSVSYATDIAPLLQHSCVRCHSPGNIGPFAMTSHDAVQSRALAIRENVLAGHMPPWHADPEYGVFTNDYSLKPGDLAKLIQWIDEGAPRGDGPDPLVDAEVPSLADYPFTWPAELGEPDVILSPPPQSVPATGVVDYRYFYARSPFASNIWLRAAIMLPGTNRQAVHHMSVYLGRVTDPMEECLAVYVPGQRQVAYPEGTGKLLPAASDITFELHYTPNGTAATDVPRLGLWLHTNRSPRALIVGSRGTVPNLSIPPFTQEWPVQREATFSRDVLVYGMNPHMHLRGARMKYEAIYPDGATEVLLSVPHYDFRWQTLYRLATPKRLPAGTRLVVSGAFDNSPQNLYNPNPSRTVFWGDQTTDEMFADFLRFSEMLTLQTQPRSAFAARGSRVTFTITASSPNPPIAYQWRFNGADIPGATLNSFIVTNAQSVHEGEYSVAVSDATDTVLSQPASLVIGDPPVISQPPVDQTAPVGGNATFSVSVTGTPPFGFSWRKESTVLTNILQSEMTSTFTIFSARTNDAGDYRVVVTNAFRTSGVPSPFATLTVTGP